MDEVLKVLSGLKGVRHAFYLNESVRKGLADIESRYPAIGPLTVWNEGVREALKREHVACIVKDASFRPPPSPTVQLVDDDGAIVGRELLPGDDLSSVDRRKVIYLGKDFVIFADRARGKGARFILPPVPFQEVEAIHGISKVCSSSPSTMGDLFIRRESGLEDDPKLASILIGFDLVRT